MSESEPSVLYEKTDHVAVITLNRPHAGNSMSRESASLLRDIWLDYKEDNSVLAAIVTAAGDRHFCTGIDLNDTAQSGGTIGQGGALRESVAWSPVHIGVMKPVICAVNGLVAGGGLHLLCDADIVVAARHAQVMDTHTTVGLVGAVENIGLLRRLPLGAVMQLTLRGRSYRMSADRAYQLGLFDELADEGETVLDRARAVAAEIAQNSPRAVALSKEAIWSALPLEPAQEFGWALARMHWAHPDFTEGRQAFRERRQPRWNS